jgi:hypothetical protein
MTNSKHTPTPWACFGQGDEMEIFVSKESDTIIRGKCLTEDAAFIVKAVNNFEPMLKELERLYALTGHCLTDQVIAAAKGDA